MGDANWSRTRSAVLVVLYLASLAGLVWNLRDTDFGMLVSDLRRLHFPWVAAAAVAMVAVYFVQGLRWRLILAPVARLPALAAARAVFVGLFASEVFPFRAGEILRCYLVTRWTQLPFSVSLASVLIERVFDGLLMWLGLELILHQTPASRLSEMLAGGLGAFVLAGAAILGTALFRPRLEHARMPASGWRKRWFVLQEDLALIGHSWYLWAALAATVPYLLLQAVPAYLLFREYGLRLGVGEAIALMMLLRLAAAVPQAPATLGLFQVLTREFLEVGFDIPAGEAARFSLVLWAMMKLPILAAGAASVLVTGSKIRELTRAASDAHSSSS